MPSTANCKSFFFQSLGFKGLKNKKLEWLIKQGEENDEDLNIFSSLVPNMKQLPPTKKLFLRSQFQNMMADEISALQINLLNLQPQVWTVLMAVGLQNRIRTGVMPTVISRKNLLQLFLQVCFCRDHRYLVFVNSYYSYRTSCNRDNIFTLILPYVLFYLPMYLSIYEFSRLPGN